jgi:glutamate/aspartate transport system permease protein
MSGTVASMTQQWSDFFAMLLWGADLPGLAGGLSANVLALVIAFTAGWCLAVPLALLRYAQVPVLGQLLQGPVLLVRGMPVLLLAFWFHLLVPLVTKQPAQAFTSATAALALYAAVSLSDMMLTGARAIAVGEIDSARSLGLRPLLILRSIVLPQMLRGSVGSSASFATTLFKDSSILYIVGVSDVLHIAMISGERHPQQMGLYYLAVALSYILICSAIAAAGAAVLRHLQQPRPATVDTPALRNAALPSS